MHAGLPGSNWTRAVWCAGFVKCSLQLLTAQVDRLQTRDNPDGDIAIPSWVDALLLALHSMVQSTAKPLEPAAPSGDAAAASPSGASVPQGPDTAAAGLGLVAPASAAALSAAGEASQPSANGNAAQGAAPANAAAPVSQQGNLLESMRESLVRTLEEQHRPGGLLSPEQQDLAAMVSAWALTLQSNRCQIQYTAHLPASNVMSKVS